MPDLRYSPLKGSKVEVRRNITSELLGTCPITNGKFSFTCKLPKNEVCRIYLDNREVVYFYTDGRPIIADMEHLTVKGGKTSQKVNDFLQTVERERMAELHETDIQKKRKSTASAASSFSRLSVKTVTISSQPMRSARSIRK